MKRRSTSFPLAVVLALLLLGALPPGHVNGASEFTVLIANDDGFDAPGLRALVEEFRAMGRVVVAAPADQQSGAGHSITYRDPIYVRTVNLGEGVEAYAVSARPATVVRVGLEALFEGKPDLVLSGINSGPNLGIVSHMSGTVGAARQAAMLGVPAIAVSRGGRADYAKIARVTRELVEALRRAGKLAPGLFLNVNAPEGEWKGVRWVRQSMAPDSEDYERRTNPRGQEYFWSRWRGPEETDLGTDVGAFANGYVTVTPFRVDQTDALALEALRGIRPAAQASRGGAN